MPRKTKGQLPKQGDAFAVPLADGRYSVCRVLRDSITDPSKKSHSVLVACSQWIGKEVPKADDPSLRPFLVLTHHSWAGEPEVLWVSDPVPDQFIALGNIQPTPDESTLECGTFGAWSSMATQPLLQWRWDNDRAAVLEDDKEKKAKKIEHANLLESQRRSYLASLELKDLLRHEFFPRWKGYPPAKAIRESRKLMTSTVRDLIELGVNAGEEEQMAILQSCIESFNQLDAKLHFIETVEREDICEEFEAIVHSCGLGKYESLADQWRDW